MSVDSMEKEKSSREVPGWFKILNLITALPVFAWPWLMSRVTFVFVEKAAGDALPWALVMLLPLYVVLSSWISYRVYSTRREISWILQGLQMLVYLALFVLIF